MKVSARAIFEEVKKNVVGQEEAIKAISFSLALQYGKQAYPEQLKLKHAGKSTLLLLGPSGNGKTHIVKESVRVLNELHGEEEFGLLSIDATDLSAGGSWSGEGILTKIKEYAKSMLETNVTNIIVFIDEIDKLTQNMYTTEDKNYYRAIQYSLLTAIEGTEIRINKEVTLDTAKILFIMAGNFPQVRKARETKQLGFTAVANEARDDIYIELQNAGLTTQLVGRIAMVAELEELTEDDLFHIAKKYVAPEINEILDMMGYRALLGDEYYRRVAKESMVRETGARGLSAIMLNEMKDVLFRFEEENVQVKSSFREEIRGSRYSTSKSSETSDTADESGLCSDRGTEDERETKDTVRARKEPDHAK